MCLLARMGRLCHARRRPEVVLPLADTQAIAFMLKVAPGTVRSWASRGHLARRGTSPDGRALYDVDEAGELYARRTMSYSVYATGHIAAQAADGTPRDAAAVELELYEALKAVLSDPRYGTSTSSFGGSHVTGSLHEADA